MADDGNAKFKAVISAEDETATAFSSIERAFQKLGFTAAQVEKEIAHLKEVDERDTMAQHFASAEAELRRLGLTASAVKGEMDRLRASQAEVEGGGKQGGFLGLFGKRGGEAHEGGGMRGEAREGGEGGGRRGGEHEGHHGWLGVREHFGALGTSIGEAGGSIAEMLPMLGALAAFGSAEGLVEMIHSTVEEQAALEAMSTQLGVTANQLEAFHYAAKMADVPVDSLDRSLGKFGVTVAQADSGQNKIAGEMFRKMGISLEDANHHLKPMTVLLPEVAQALKNTEDPQMRLYLATTLFGRAGREMLPLLLRGADGIKLLTDQAERLGPQLTDVDRNHLQQFNDSWKKADYVVHSFMDRLSADLAPVMTPLLDDFTNWVAANKDWLSLKVTDGVKELAKDLSAIPWAEIGSDTKAIAGGFNQIVKETVGWNAVIELIMARLALKVASPFLNVIHDLKEIILLGEEAAFVFNTTLPAAFRVAAEAEEAFDAKFKGSLTGRLAATAFATYDLATKDTKVDLNPAQKKLADSFHLQAGQHLSSDQARQLDSLASPGENSVVGAPGGQSGVIRRLEKLFGIPDGEPAAPIAGTGEPIEPGRRQIAPGLYRPLPLPPSAGFAAPSAPVGNTGTITYHVVFENVPPNVTITTTTSGDVGVNMLGGQN